MALTIKHDGTELTNAKFYETRATIIGTGDGALLAPGRTVAFSTAGEKRVLSYHASGGTVAVRADGGESFAVDNLTSKVWNGKHCLPDASAPTVVDGRYNLVDKSAQCEHFDTAQLVQQTSWCAVLCVKRVVASFAGDAPLLTFSGNGNQIRPFVLTQNGTVKADGIYSGGVTRGRTSGAGCLANDERAIFVIFASVEDGWRIWKNQLRVDTTNIGSGAGVTFSQFVGWNTPNLLVGGTSGCVHLERVMMFGGCSRNEAVKYGIRLNLELSVY
jgi:hypothetical protein